MKDVWFGKGIEGVDLNPQRIDASMKESISLYLKGISLWVAINLMVGSNNLFPSLIAEMGVVGQAAHQPIDRQKGITSSLIG